MYISTVYNLSSLIYTTTTSSTNSILLHTSLSLSLFLGGFCFPPPLSLFLIFSLLSAQLLCLFISLPSLFSFSFLFLSIDTRSPFFQSHFLPFQYRQRERVKEKDLKTRGGHCPHCAFVLPDFPVSVIHQQGISFLRHLREGRCREKESLRILDGDKGRKGQKRRQRMKGKEKERK